MKKVVKFNKMILVTIVTVCMFAGLYFGRLQVHAVENVQTGVAVTGVQLRADVASGSCYLVINTDEYSEVEPGTPVTNIYKYADLLTRVTLYTSKDDTTGIQASEICNWGGWVMNLWGSSGVMFPIPVSTYEEAYNGSTVYSVKIEEGTVLPCGDKDLVVAEKVHLINSGYGEEDSRYWAVSWAKYKRDVRYDMEFTGIQIRADLNAGIQFLVLQSADYKTISPGMLAPLVKNYRQLLSDIIIYTSPEDTKGVKASSVCEESNWEMNKWLSEGLMLPIKGSAFDKYNGSTVYKIEIAKGAVLPCETYDLEVKEKTVYYNSSYGKEDAVDWAIDWSYTPSEVESMGNCSPVNISNRYDDGLDTRWLILTMDESFDRADVSSWIEQLNFLDYVEYYNTEDLEADSIKLRDIYGGVVSLHPYGSAEELYITIDQGHSGVEMYAVRILDGCQVPYFVNGEYGYKTVEGNHVFVNANWGKSGDIFGMYDAEGNAITYEQESTEWIASREISFTVEGLEGQTYPAQLFALGETILTSDFAVEGYDVELTSADGKRCIGGYIVEEDSKELFITYKEAAAETEDNNLLYIVVGVAGILVLLILIVTVLTIRRKKVVTAS